MVWAYAEEKRGALRRKEGDESRLRLREKEERNTYIIEHGCASHGRNMLPMRRCLTGPTQSPLSLMDFLRGDWLSMVT